jgi:hypothetical protein
MTMPRASGKLSPEAAWNADYLQRKQAELSSSTASRPGPASSPARPLSDLAAAVAKARDDMMRARSAGSSRSELRQYRSVLGGALATYIEELSARRLPVPYGLRDEFRLIQTLRD